MMCSCVNWTASSTPCAGPCHCTRPPRHGQLVHNFVCRLSHGSVTFSLLQSRASVELHFRFLKMGFGDPFQVVRFVCWRHVLANVMHTCACAQACAVDRVISSNLHLR
jgi:hypothetical protein